jgi:hypothetical protein
MNSLSGGLFPRLRRLYALKNQELYPFQWTTCERGLSKSHLARKRLFQKKASGMYDWTGAWAA